MNAAIYYPWLRVPDPAAAGTLRSVPPSGAVAAVYARTEVWQSPAGTRRGAISGTSDLTRTLNDAQSGALTIRGINTLRTFPGAGLVVWGARTCQGNDMVASEWKYVPVRRTALFIERSLVGGLQWVAFEPNDETLWARIRLSVGAFMQGMFRKGALQGNAPDRAWFVKCDQETTTHADIAQGNVNILVGFAPLKPGEFVTLSLRQVASQTRG